MKLVDFKDRCFVILAVSAFCLPIRNRTETETGIEIAILVDHYNWKIWNLKCEKVEKMKIKGQIFNSFWMVFLSFTLLVHCAVDLPPVGDHIWNSPLWYYPVPTGQYVHFQNVFTHMNASLWLCVVTEKTFYGRETFWTFFVSLWLG